MYNFSTGTLGAFGTGTLGTGLNTGFGSGLNISKKKEEERFPGLNPAQIRKIEEDTQHIPESERADIQNELYRRILPLVEQQRQKEERMNITNQQYSDSIKYTDQEQQKLAQGQIRASDLATKIKDQYGIPMSVNDNDVLGRLVEQLPDSQSFTDYLNGKNEDLLYELGLKEKPIKLSDTKGKNPLIRGAGGLLGGAWGTVKGLYEGLIPGFGEMVDNTKKILDDPNKSSGDKFAQIVIGEGIGGYLGGIIGHTFGGTLEGLYKGFTSESEREFVDQNVKNVMESIVESKPGQYIMDQYNKLDENDKEELNDMLRYTMGYVDIATLMIGGPVATKAGKTGIEGAVKATEKVATSKAGKLIGETAEAIVKTPKPSEVIAKTVTKTASPQDKLFKAQNPSLNVLSKKKNIKSRRANSDLANELIVRDGHIPADTETRRIAHEVTMDKKWNEIETAIGKKANTKVDQNQFADILDKFIADTEKAGLQANKSDIAALKAESQAMRNQGPIDLATLEKKKQLINGLVNNWGDAKVGDVYANGMKQVTRAIGEAEDKLIAELPGEFSTLKKEFGALKDAYEDVLKADIKNQRSKGIGLIQSYSRIEGVSDILGGAISMFTRGGEAAKDVVKGVGKLFMGKSLKKATDPDFLIKEGFEGLVNKLKAPKIKAPIAPANSKATIKSPTAVKETAKKTVNESIPELKATVKAPEVDTSYRIGHQIDTKKSSPITSIDGKKIDIFVDEFKKQYGYPSLKSKELNKFKEIMKNPEADVKIYRASPKNELNQGDWVTIDKTYANDIKRQNGGKVYEYNVKAKELLYPNTIEGFNELPSLNKWGAFQYNKTKGLSVKNESIPQLKATVKAPEEALLKEARKYKSADEFVNTMANKHRPPEIEGKNTMNNNSDVYPEDLYGPNGLRYYGFQKNDADIESYNIIKKMRNKPEGEVTIYRAILPNETPEILPGDWVTPSKKYANIHGKSNLNDQYIIIEKKVKAKELTTSGDDLNERGYRPDNHKDFDRAQLKQIREEANK